MSGENWTPGPWGCTYRVEWNHILIKPKDKLGHATSAIAKVPAHEGRPAQFDACLIAAAPELYAALDTLLDVAIGFNVSGVYLSEDGYCKSALDVAEAALAKARGEQP